jgi:peroxiredoxin
LDITAETMTLEIGQSAPDFHVQLADGRTVGRADFHGRPLVLIFLRHLA